MAEMGFRLDHKNLKKQQQAETFKRRSGNTAREILGPREEKPGRKETNHSKSCELRRKYKINKQQQKTKHSELHSILLAIYKFSNGQKVCFMQSLKCSNLIKRCADSCPGKNAAGNKRIVIF